METTIYTVNGQSFELRHYGVKGMRWGHRKAQRYENRARRLDRRANTNRVMGSIQRATQAETKNALARKAFDINANYYEKRAKKLSDKADRTRAMATPEAMAARKEAQKQKLKRAAKIGAAVAATALAAYGAKKVHDVIRDKNKQIYLKKAREYVNNNRQNGVYNISTRYADYQREMMAGVYRRSIRGHMDAARRMASEDSFKDAVKNVRRYRKYGY